MGLDKGVASSFPSLLSREWISLGRDGEQGVPDGLSRFASCAEGGVGSQTEGHAMKDVMLHPWDIGLEWILRQARDGLSSDF